MLACAGSDLKRRIIPNRLILVMLVLGAAKIIYGCWIGESIFAYVFSIPLFLLCLLCWQKGAMGGGDVKIISVICLYLGLWQTALAFIVTIAVMFLWYGLVRIAFGRGEMHIRIPLAPPLALGSIAVLAINYLWII